MIKNPKKLLLSSIIILLPILFGLAVWEQLPEQVPTHWGASGDPDGWSSKAFAVFFMPLFLVALHWLCVFATGKDPKNQGQHQKLIGMVYWLVPAISLLVSGMMYTAALGYSVSATAVLPAVLGVMFIVIGNYLPKCKQNSTIGIKIKWTLENEENWNATHRFGGKLFVVGGFVLLGCAFLPAAAVIWVILPVMLMLTAVPMIYSYLYYKKHP